MKITLLFLGIVLNLHVHPPTLKTMLAIPCELVKPVNPFLLLETNLHLHVSAVIQSKIIYPALNSITSIEPSYYHQVARDPNWHAATADEINALDRNKTWELTSLPPENMLLVVSRCIESSLILMVLLNTITWDSSF